MSTKTNIVSLLPTFARPWLALCAIQQWLDQTHPLNQRRLVVGCDDDDPAAFNAARLADAIRYKAGQGGAGRIHLMRLPGNLSLPEKLTRMWEHAGGFLANDADLFTVWEDDDLYLPAHLEQIARSWNQRNRPETWWGHPSHVWSDYTGDLCVEPATGRFHASLAFTGKALERVHGWPITSSPDFDQQLIGKLTQQFGQPAQYDLLQIYSSGDSATFPASGKPRQARPTYCFLWHTGSTHGQHTMPAENDWQIEAKARLLRELSHRHWDLFVQMQPRTVRLRDRLTNYNQHPYGPTVTLTQAGIAAATFRTAGAVPSPC
jgi:hypothetical protein